MTAPPTEQDVLEYAISLEQNAAQTYADLAAKSRSASRRQLFLEFAEEEMAHRRKLEDVLEGEQMIGTGNPLADLKISDYAVNVVIGDSPSYQDILLFAMQQEKQALRLYTDLANRVAEPVLKSLFLALAQEEAKHKHRFESEYDEHILTEN